MKLLKLLLVVVIAATGVIGSARAQTPPGNTFNLGTLTPAGVSQPDSFPSGSFRDTFNFTVDASNHIVTGGVTAASNVNGSLTLWHGDPTAQFLFSGSSAPQFNSTDFTPGNWSAEIDGSVVDPKAGNGTFTFSMAANPEPAEWALLLCGLVVAGFIARRKISLVAA